MNTHTDKTRENKSKAVANEVTQMQPSSEASLQFVDNRPEAVVQRRLQAIANNSPQAQQAAQFRAIANNQPIPNQQPIQKKEAPSPNQKGNNTGLPDNLKSGIENLSGISMDDVKVHRNSDKPAQLQAYAYAQGSDIHLASGQERHLPHEAWHVVQQKQGRVKPTMQMKGRVNENDDGGLEREADVMGRKAMQLNQPSNNPFQTKGTNKKKSLSTTSTFVQKKRINIPHAKKSIGTPLGEKDSDGDDIDFLRGWITEAAQTNREALAQFVQDISIEPLSTNDKELQALGRQALAAAPAPLVDNLPDEFGQRTSHIGPGIIDAQRVDYTNSKSYLSEGEGTVLATQWDVDAEIYDQPNSNEKLIRHIIRYGNGNTHHGHLLFVNQNHYIVITPTAGEAFDFIDRDRNKFNRSGQVTVADGNCLIDGLFILGHNRNGQQDDFLAARRILATGISDEDITQIIITNISDMLAGIRPPQLGPEVAARLEADPVLAGLYEDARKKRSEEASKKEGLQKSLSSHVSSPESDKPVMGIPGYAPIGPTKSEEAESQAIHRGIAEVEEHEGKYYVRMYSSVAAAANFTSNDLDTGEGTSEFKDIQQDVESGKVIISTGANSMLWVSGGRILRQLKWAEKYIAEHKVKAQKANDDATALEATLPGKEDAVQIKIREEVTELREKAKFHASINKPLMRSFLIPLETFNNISRRAISENLITNDGNTDKTFNVDRHAESNQFGVRGKDLELLREQALPGSLVTYAHDLEAASKDKRSGEVRNIMALRERLGIPTQELEGESVWIEGDGFIDRKHLKPQADKLNMHYVTWLQTLEKTENPDHHPLLSKQNENIPFKVRVERLNEFLAKNNIKGDEATKEFMNNVVVLWANQAMIEFTMAEDYDRINKDENVKSVEESTFGTNAFGENLEQAKARKEKVQNIGDQLDKLVKSDTHPVAMVDLLIRELPELKPFFIKISAKSEGYEFYEHAQMVLGQFFKVARTEEERLISRSAMAKMILFHDMEKTNSKSQYGKDPEGEHLLTVEMMGQYRDLWEDEAEFQVAKAMVSGDPFGEYMKGKISTDETFMQIVELARQAGFTPENYQKFYQEFHQFYQADFSSYSTQSSYFPRNDKDSEKRKKIVPEEQGGKGFERFFSQDATQNFETLDKKQRFKYAPELEQKFTSLEGMFKDVKTIYDHIIRLDPTFNTELGKKSESQIKKERSRKEKTKTDLDTLKKQISTFLKTYLRDDRENKIEALAKGLNLQIAQIPDLEAGTRKIKPKQVERFTQELQKHGFDPGED